MARRSVAQRSAGMASKQDTPLLLTPVLPDLCPMDLEAEALNNRMCVGICSSTQCGGWPSRPHDSPGAHAYAEVNRSCHTVRLRRPAQYGDQRFPGVYLRACNV